MPLTAPHFQLTAALPLAYNRRMVAAPQPVVPIPPVPSPAHDPLYDTSKSIRQLASLRQIIESISTELELEPLLTRIVVHACELLDAENGTIGLVDESRGVIRTAAAHNMPPSELGAEVAPGVGLFGLVYNTHESCILQQYAEVENPVRPELLHYTVIGMPIFWREQVIGVFGLGSPPPRQFDADDVQVLALYAKHAAIAIENARFFDAERRRSARILTIQRIGQLITSHLELDEILQTAVEAIYEHLTYRNIAVLLVDPEDPETLVLRARGGFYRTAVIGEYHQSVRQGIIGAAAVSRRRVLIPDVRRDPRYIPIPGAEEIRCELAIPIVAKEQLVGVLNIESARNIAPDAEDLQIIADQLGIAIEHARLFTAAQQALDDLKLLYATSARIGAAMREQEVIVAYLEQVATRGQYTCNVATYEFNDAGERTTVVVRGRWSQREGLQMLDERFPHSRDALDPALDAGETITIEDVRTDPRVSPELRAMQLESGRPALAFIPLMAHGQRIGLVILSYPAAHVWNAGAMHPYQATAAQLASALDSRRQQRLAYETSQDVAILEERHRLARELHDSVTQLLFSVTLIAQSISPAWKRDAAEGERRVSRLVELSQQALAEMRALLKELRPREPASPPPVPLTATPGIVILRERGLLAALDAHVAQLRRDGLNVQLETHAYRPSGPAEQEALFRIAQEALNNVIKHAHASHVHIEITSTPTTTRLSVKDDGQGFTPAPENSASGMGLTTMRERAEQLGGAWLLTSEPGQGTTVEVNLPRDEDQ